MTDRRPQIRDEHDRAGMVPREPISVENAAEWPPTMEDR